MMPPPIFQVDREHANIWTATSDRLRRTRGLTRAAAAQRGPLTQVNERNWS